MRAYHKQTSDFTLFDWAARREAALLTDGARWVRGREAWALLSLIASGERGCTPIDNPGPRWSAYVCDLRRRGIAVETVPERHAGPFPGSHARYVLRSRVAVLKSTEGEAA